MYVSNMIILTILSQFMRAGTQNTFTIDAYSYTVYHFGTNNSPNVLIAEAKMKGRQQEMVQLAEYGTSAPTGIKMFQLH